MTIISLFEIYNAFSVEKFYRFDKNSCRILVLQHISYHIKTKSTMYYSRNTRTINQLTTPSVHSGSLAYRCIAAGLSLN